MADGADEVVTEPDWPPPPPSADDLRVGAPPVRVLVVPADDDPDPNPEVTDTADPHVTDEVTDVADPAATGGGDVQVPEVADVTVVETAGLEDLRARLAAVDTPRQRFAVLTDLAEVPLDGDALVTLLDALPPGWQRRTALRTLVRGGGDIDDLDAAAVLRRFERPSERSAAASLLVGAGLAHVGTVVDHLDRSAAARLRRRR